MTARVKKIVDQVKALPAEERDEFLSWLAEFEVERRDQWDDQIARDARPDGPLDRVLNRVRQDIAEGKVKPLDEVLDDS